MLLVSLCVPVITWLCSRVMRFQSRPTNWPLLTIESPVAQWLEHPTRSRRVVGSNPIWGSDFFRVLQTFNLSCVCCFIFNIHISHFTGKKKGWSRVTKIPFTSLLIEGEIRSLGYSPNILIVINQILVLGIGNIRRYFAVLKICVSFLYVQLSTKSRLFNQLATNILTSNTLNAYRITVMFSHAEKGKNPNWQKKICILSVPWDPICLALFMENC